MATSYFPALTGDFTRLLGLLRGRRVAVVGHARPDGDCIGTQVALAGILRRHAGCEVVCVNPDGVPRRLDYLARGENFVRAADFVPAGWSVFYVDCADQLRATRRLAEAVGRPCASLDHHLSNTRFAEVNLVDERAAAAAEILAGLAFDAALGLTPVEARALYAGIATDTGQFRFPSTTRRVFELSGRLIDAGADPAQAGEQIYERESPAKLALLQHFLSSFTYELGGRVCVGRLERGIFERLGALPEDTEGLVDHARGIEGVEVGVLLEDRPDGTKGSLRARRPEVAVHEVAALFGGGGHACAAGFNTARPVGEVLPAILASLAGKLQS